jgi:hypothetical protein
VSLLKELARIFESPEVANYRDIDFDFKDQDAVAFGFTAKGDLHLGGSDDVPEEWKSNYEFGDAMTHRRLAGLNFLEKPYDQSGISVSSPRIKPWDVYKTQGRSWFREVTAPYENPDKCLFISFWNEPTNSQVDKIVQALASKYNSKFDRVFIQREGAGHAEWEEVSMSKVSMSKNTPSEKKRVISTFDKRLKELEYQLHTADPSQKAFIRKGIEAHRAKSQRPLFGFVPTVESFTHLFHANNSN